MKNLIKSRRGIAIEMAIGAMFVMIALSIVLISISGMQTRHMKSDLNDFHEKVERYEVVDKLLSSQQVTNGMQIVTSAEKYYTVTKSDEIDNDNTFEYVVKDTNNNTVLTFTTDKNGKITSWGK